MVPKKYDFKFEVKDNAHFSLTGLFNGNKELSEYLIDILGNKWKLFIKYIDLFVTLQILDHGLSVGILDFEAKALDATNKYFNFVKRIRFCK